MSAILEVIFGVDKPSYLGTPRGCQVHYRADSHQDGGWKDVGVWVWVWVVVMMSGWYQWWWYE